MNNNYYTWITDNVAIGELNSKYDDFDIIINVAYINPSFNKGLEPRKYRYSKYNYEIHEFGLYDSDNDVEYIKEVIEYIVPELLKKSKNKILFHCQSGKSRSVSIALAYLCKFYNIKSDQFDMFFDFLKEKRHVINPRPCFISKVKEYLYKND